VTALARGTRRGYHVPGNFFKDKDMDAETTWECLPFADLGGSAVYALLKLRSEVFVVEQECPYLDPDGLDQDAFHHLVWRGGMLLAYQRCLPPGSSYAEDSAMGRIVVDRAHRSTGLGRELVQRGIDFNFTRWPGRAIRISAQSHLEAFYRSLGFETCSGQYLEDGIPHTDMRLAAPAISDS
jgi:ElaA protein